MKTWGSFAILMLLCAPLWSDVIGTGGIRFDSDADGSPEAILNTTGLALGTSSPGAKVHVEGNAMLSGMVHVGGSTSPSSNLELRGNFTTSHRTTSVVDLGLDDHSIYLADTTTPGTNIMLVVPGGDRSGRLLRIKKTSNDHEVKIYGGWFDASYSSLVLDRAEHGFP